MLEHLSTGQTPRQTEWSLWRAGGSITAATGRRVDSMQQIVVPGHKTKPLPPSILDTKGEAVLKGANI